MQYDYITTFTLHLQIIKIVQKSLCLKFLLANYLIFRIERPCVRPLENYMGEMSISWS